MEARNQAGSADAALEVHEDLVQVGVAAAVGHFAAGTGPNPFDVSFTFVSDAAWVVLGEAGSTRAESPVVTQGLLGSLAAILVSAGSWLISGPRPVHVLLDLLVRSLLLFL